MHTFISFFNTLQTGLLAIGPFLLLLGVLIFIHELGHFLAARYFGVKVEVFSLGFGPKILKYKKGETIYCISLFPLGGYVKMFGDNPLLEVPDSEKSQGFLYKSVPAKWLIAFAGPLMNLLFALLAYFLLALTGQSVIPSKLGDISPDTQAYSDGFRSGDLILSIKNQKVSYYEEITKIIKDSIGKNISFKVQSQEGNTKTLFSTPQNVKNSNPLQWKKTKGNIEGLSPFSKGLSLGIIYNSPAFKAGLQTFDEVMEINGQKLKYWRELKTFIQKTKTDTLSFKIKREQKIKTFVLKLPNNKTKKSSSLSQALGVESSSLYINRVGPDTPAKLAGLSKGDKLLSIDNEPVKSWKQVLDKVKFSSGRALSLTYQRKGKSFTVSLSPKPLFVEGNVKKRFMLGIVSGGKEVLPDPILKNYSLFQAVIYSGEETYQMLGFIITGLVRLFQGEISLRTIGGPVMIGRVAHSHFHQGFSSFFYLMALISLNLFLLNLLPIPMLDGGHILFFTLEGILRKPLSLNKLIVAQHMGLLILISFMGLAFFNDIYNWLKAW